MAHPRACFALSVLTGACSSDDDSAVKPVEQSAENPATTTPEEDDSTTTTEEAALPTDPVRVAGDEITPLQGGMFHNRGYP